MSQTFMVVAQFLAKGKDLNLDLTAALVNVWDIHSTGCEYFGHWSQLSITLLLPVNVPDIRGEGSKYYDSSICKETSL